MKENSSSLSEHAYLGNRMIPCVLLLLVNILGGFHLLPIFIQLLVSSASCVYLGAILSSRLGKAKSGHMQVDHHGNEAEVIGQKQALKFPIVASCFLFGIYLVYKYVNKDLINILITLQFCISTVISTTNILVDFIPFGEGMNKQIKKVKTHKFLKQWFEIEDFTISPGSILCFCLSAIPVVTYYITKYWALNNVFGILFSIFALRNINLSSFKVGFILLWLLFVYDIFWVYGTDVMVSVAKNLDIPIKLLFPYLNEEGVQKFSMLGLGDIVLPGVFVSLCLKFDIDQSLKNHKPKSISDFKIPYFTTCVIWYILGICATFAAMYIFNHPQPALLFLVPACTLSVAVLALFRGQKDAILAYESSQKKKTQQEMKKQ